MRLTTRPNKLNPVGTSRTRQFLQQYLRLDDLSSPRTTTPNRITVLDLIQSFNTRKNVTNSPEVTVNNQIL